MYYGLARVDARAFINMTADLLISRQHHNIADTGIYPIRSGSGETLANLSFGVETNLSFDG